MTLTKLLLVLALIFSYNLLFSQYSDCSSAGEACTKPNFNVTPSGFGSTEDFSVFDNISNPSSPVNPPYTNDGCLTDGELNSTWLIMTIASSGSLAFSMGSGGLFNTDYYDWALWPYDSNTCSGISNNTLAPVACNFNADAIGFTGMANPSNIPPPGTTGNFQNEINVTAGERYIICFSNWSSASTTIPLNFFGSASVSCGSAIGATICEGSTAIISVLDGVSYAWNSSIPGFLSTNATGDSAYVNPSITTDYTVVITFQDGSTKTETATVTVLPKPNLTVNPTLETCQGDNNGALNISVSNPSNPTTYTLSGQSNASNSTGIFNNLQSGNYTVNVVNGNGCTEQISTTLAPGPVCCSMLLSVSKVDNLCFNDTNGSALLDTSGTSGPAQIQWFDNTGTAIPGANSLTLTNLSAGNYSVQVTDASCTLTENFTITQPTLLTISETHYDLTCNQNGTGTINISGTGGTSPYQYSIDNGSNYSSNGVFTGLTSDIYSIAIKDANNCFKNIQVTITEPDILQESVIIQNNTCHSANGACDGEILLAVNGGTPPFNYQWNNGIINSGNPIGICANTYSVNITDANGCSISVSNIIVTEPNEIIITDIIYFAPLCNNDCNGTIEIDHLNGVNFSIDNGQTFQTNNQFNDLCPGVYPLVISDNNGCRVVSNFSLISPGAVEANFTFGPQPATTNNPEISFNSTSINADNELYYVIISDDTVFLYNSNSTFSFPENEPGNYEVCLVASNLNGCIDTICNTVIIDDVFYIFVPNAFSPNDDGYNDIFYPIVNRYDEDNFEMLIFNKWGQLIFESSSPSNGWDGTSKGTDIQQDVYIWKINTISKDDGLTKTYTGHISLLR